MPLKYSHQKHPLIVENLQRLRRMSPHHNEADDQEGLAANLPFGSSPSPRDLAEQLMHEHGVSRARAHEMIKESGM